MDIVQLKQGLRYTNTFAEGKHNIPREGSPGGGNGRGFKGDPMGERPERSPGPPQVRRDIARIVSIIK